LDVAEEIEIKFVIKCGIDGICRRDKKECVAVRRRTYDRLGGEIGGGARSAFDDNRLAKPLREPLARQASGNVSRAARGIPEDQPKRLSRIGLSPSDA